MHQSDIDEVTIQERELQSKSAESMIVNGENNRMMIHHDHNESTFGAFGNELDDDGQNMVGDKELVNVAWKSSRKSQIITKEYGFDYEYNDHDSNEDDDDDDDDDEDDNKNENGDQKESLKDQFIAKLAASINIDIQTNNNPNNISYSINLLGKKYHPILDYTLRREDETNLFWFSYRCDFAEIKPEGITSDAGWGCMLRSAQMLIGQALRVHYCGRQWKAPKSNVRRRGDPFMQDLMMWLADFPSACTGCWYSLHNMVAAGLTRYDVLPGEWFGPGTACHVLRDLSELHERAWERKYRNEPSVSSTTDTTTKLRVNNNNQLMQYHRDLKPVMRVYVAPEGSIYRLEVDKLMTKDNKKNTTEESKSREEEPDNDDDGYDKVDFDALLEDPLLHPLSEIEQKESREEIPWDNSLLILLPLRLGLKTFNASKYKVPLSHVLSFPQSVGFLGGSPRHALWFYGANSDGSKVYGLDPHTVQRAPRRRRLRPEEELRTGNTKQYQVQLSDEYLRSLNAPNISSMDMSRIDPSLALGFYCRDRADFESLCAAVDDMKTNEVTKDFPALFSFADARPDYNADLSSAMMDMMMGGSSSQLDEEEDNDDDEDDFVII